MFGLTTWKKKIQILTNCNKLKGSKLTIKEDYPQDVVETRKKLYPLLKKYREQNKNAVIKYDKLFVNGQEVSVPDDDTNMNEDEMDGIEEENQDAATQRENKRAASTSPGYLEKQTKKITKIKSNIGSPVTLVQSKLTNVVNKIIDNSPAQTKEHD